jgi:hypothetical protein
MKSIKRYLKSKPAKAIKIMRIKFNIKDSRRMQ